MNVALNFRSALSVSLLALLTVCAPPSVSCAPQSADELPHDLGIARAAREALLAVPVTAGSEHVFSAEMRTAIDEMKRSIAVLVREYLAILSVDDPPDTLTIEAELNRLITMTDAPAMELPNQSAARAGARALFTVTLSQDTRELLQVVARFSLPCGEDSLLFVFQPKKGKWREVLEWHSDSYNSIAGGFNLLTHRISPSDSDDRWYVLVAHNPARCSSCWGIQRYHVLRPVAGQTAPKILLEGFGPAYECNELPVAVESRAESFAICFDGRSIDAEVPFRKHIRRYKIKGDQIERLQPVAKNVRDFVDEWITSPWGEARSWTNNDAQPRLGRAHRKLQRIARGSKLKFGEMTTVREDGVSVVELWEDEYEEPTDAPSWWFSVRQDGVKFELADIYRTGVSGK